MENSTDIKKILICTVVAFIVLFGLGGLWHFVLFSDYYFHNPLITVARRPTKVNYIMFGELLRAVTMAWLFLKIHSSGASKKEGMIFGLVTGIAGAALMGFINFGVIWFPFTWVVMETVFALLQGTAAGWALAIANKKI